MSYSRMSLRFGNVLNNFTLTLKNDYTRTIKQFSFNPNISIFDSLQKASIIKYNKCSNRMCDKCIFRNEDNQKIKTCKTFLDKDITLKQI